MNNQDLQPNNDASTEAPVQGQGTDLPQSIQNADMYESITGPTASKVEQDLQDYKSHDYHRLIPELGVSEGCLAVGDNVLLAAEDFIQSNDIAGEMNVDGSVPRKDFRIPKTEMDGVAYPVCWESNLTVSSP